MTNRGLILVNTGEGKGKTTAALGTALRSIGRGMNVLILQFIKSGKNYGELKALEAFPNVTVRSMGKGFIFHNQEENPDKMAEHIAKAEEAWAMLEEEVHSGKWDMIILDEINYAIGFGLIAEERVLELLDTKPEALNMILTGRNATEGVIARADTVTEMKMIKHAYQKGINAKPGIEL